MLGIFRRSFLLRSILRPIRTFLVFSFVAIGSIRAADTTSNWLGGTGNWNDPVQWSTNPSFPNNGGGKTYSTFVNSGSPTLNQNITVNKFTFGQSGTPTLLGTNILNVNTALSLNQGVLRGSGTVNALGTAAIAVSSNLYGWSLNLSGTTTWTGGLGLGNQSVIDNLAGATINLASGAFASFYVPHDDTGNQNAAVRTLNNHGTINCDASPGTATLDVSLNNSGTINVNSGTLVLSNGGPGNTGSFAVANGALLDFERTNLPGGDIYNFAAGSSIAGGGSVKFGYGTFNVSGTYNIAGTTTIGGGVKFLSTIGNLGNSVVINGQGSLDLGANSVTLNNFTLTRGALTGTATLTVTNQMEWNEGSMVGGGVTNASGGVFFNGLTMTDQLDRTLNCYGNSSVQTTNAYAGYLYFGLNGVINVMPAATFNGSRLSLQGSSTVGQALGTFANYGTLIVDDPSLNRGMSAFGSTFKNYGTIQITSSTLDVRSNIHPGASIIQESGAIVLNNGKIGDSVEIKAGTSMSGYGTSGAIINSGLLAPSSGTLNFFQGAVTLQSGSVLFYELDGTPVSYGQMINVGSAALAGTLQVRFAHGAQTQFNSSNALTLMSGHNFTGQFANIASGQRLITSDGRASFVVTYNATSLVLSQFQASNFSDWETAFFSSQQLNDPSIAGPAATPQKDGAANLLKYLCDINPSVAMSASERAALPVPNLSVIGGVRYLTLTYRKNPLINGITIGLATSSDLHAWQSVAPDIEQAVGTDPVTGDPIIQVGIKVGGTRQFLGLTISQS